MKWVRRIGCLTVLVLIAILGTVVFLFPSSRPERNSSAGRTVRGNVAVLGGDVWIEENERIPGNLLIVGDDLLLEGRIGGSLVVVGGNAELISDAAVGGDVSVIGGDALVRDASAVGGRVAVVGGDIDLTGAVRVGGNVSVIGGRIWQDPEVLVGGGTGWQHNANTVSPQSRPSEAPAPLAQPAPPARPESPETAAGTRGDEVQAQLALHQQAELEAVAEAEAQAEAFRAAAKEAAAEARAQAASTRTPWLLVLFGKLLKAFLWTLLFTSLVLLVNWLIPRQVKAMAETAEKETALSFATGAIGVMGSAGLITILTITICFALLALPLLALIAVVVLCGWAVSCYWLGRRLDELVAVRGDISWNPLISVGISSLAITGVTAFSWAIFPCLGFITALLIGSTGTGAVIVHAARRSGRFPVRVSEGSPEYSPPDLASGADVGPTGTPELHSEEESHPYGRETSGIEPATWTIADQPEREDATIQPAAGESEPPANSGAGTAGQEATDDLTRIAGIGPVYARRLVEAGITSYSQLALMDAVRIAEVIGCPAARVEREQLREQAGALAEME